MDRVLFRLKYNIIGFLYVNRKFVCGLWLVFKSVLPEAVIMGCVFHWTQALRRKVSKIQSTLS